MAATQQSTTTVWQAFYDILRHYDMKTIFGNPGSTEQPMLKNFPPDFKYVLGLQEATVVAMADGYAQAVRKPTVVSLHTAAGTGNGMGNIMTAALNKTPLIVIAGQQHRDMLIGDPLLTNREETMIARPWVKWAYQPVTAQDVPAAVTRAIATAMLPPQGPVYLSIPLDDWDKDVTKLPIPRLVSTRIAPDPELIAVFCSRLHKATAPALVYGQEVDKSLGWEAGVQLAEMLGAPVYQAPGAERAVFPETHPLYKGGLPMARGPLCAATAHHDVILVVGAEVWRYYPYVDGPIAVPDQVILHVTNDPHDASTAIIGDSILSDAKLALQSIVQRLMTLGLQIKSEQSRLNPPQTAAISGNTPLTALDAFTILARHRPKGAKLLQESPSNMGDLLQAWPAYEPEHYFTFASGGLGWNGPASVGVALAQKYKSSKTPTFLVIGDGSINYSVQFLYSAAREHVRLIILVPRNEEYAILKEFAVLEKTPAVPALDLPGLDAVAIAKAYGCAAYRADSAGDLEEAIVKALNVEGPVLIEFAIDRSLRPLVRPAK